MGASLGNGRGRGRDRLSRHPFTEINVTPMVDVMLVLLVIFMVTAPMLTAGVNVDLPKADAAPLPGQDEPLSVSVASGGKIFIQKTEVQLKDLSTKLNAIAGQKHDTRIFVRGDKTVDYGRVMQVVAQISGAGFPKVSLVTEAPTTPPGK